MTTERPPPGTGLGPPVYTQSGGWVTPPTGGGLPSEIAACISLDGTGILDAETGVGGTRPASRKRNRKYIGPLGASTTVTDTNTKEVGIAQVFRDALNAAFKSIMYDAMTAKGWAPNVFSEFLWQLFPILSTWVDNAFDTQRRRGVEATLRSVGSTQGSLEAALAIWASHGVNIEVLPGDRLMRA